MNSPLAQPALAESFRAAMPYDQYVAAGKPNEVANWQAFHARVALTPAQRTLIAGFSRQINVLCLSGTWCGDCVQQVPLIDHIQRACLGKINARYLERDAHKALSDALKVCGGNRVPITIFLNEDLEFVSLFGDRTLNRYRALAAKQLGGACPIPGATVPNDEIAAQLQDWVDEFERVNLLLRLSSKLRQRHGD
ncbi:MAG: thioredoxin family protein [Phycisphaerales bacterium]|nr:thioredoxin family protein [Phycisphaerales bacterium]